MFRILSDFDPWTASRRAMRRTAPVMFAVLVLALAACSGNKEEEVVPDQPVEQLYNDAMDQLMADDYEKAAKLFDEVERQHPYSVWATKSQLMSAFAHYRNSDYAEAVVTLDHFIELHPAHENIDYAYYLRALCYYERITDVSRDQQMTERARNALEELVNRFPDSKYAADAKPKLILVRDQLAGKEMDIGRYYQKTGHYLAAINRFDTVVTKYQTTSHVPEALLRLTELYTALGVTNAAQEYASVLGYNFPGSDWYQDSYDLVTHDGRKVPPPLPNPAGQESPAASDSSAAPNAAAAPTGTAAKPTAPAAEGAVAPPANPVAPPLAAAPGAASANPPAEAAALPPYSTGGIIGVPYPGY